MNKILLEDGWSVDNIAPNDYGCNLKRYHNWIAIVTGRDDEGKEIREYLKDTYASDCYFFFGNKVSEGDIIAVGCYDRHKAYKSVCKYYKVFGVTTEEIILSDMQTTYLKAKKIEKEEVA